MTVVIVLGEKLGWLRTPPPTQITTAIANRLGTDAGPAEPRFDVGTLIAHAGFGTVAGALYGGARSRLPNSPLAAGTMYGGFVWATAYGGYLPAFRLYPSLDDDRRSRSLVMIVAHIVYGVTLVATEQRLRARFPGARDI